MGNGGNGRLIRLFGYQEELSLDPRGRFRLPDNLVAVLHQELGRVRHVDPSLAQGPAVERLSFYLVPGTRKRIFIYPTPNVGLAIESFESPPPGIDPEIIRHAREYLYHRMRYVEADKQNRVAISEGLRDHAEIDESVQQITLTAHNCWLALTRSELAEQRVRENLEAFKQAAPDLLDPVNPRPPAAPGLSAEEDL